MPWPRGRKHVQIKAACRFCGAEVWRSTHYHKATCLSCRRAAQYKREKGRERKLRQEARRYRIILHVLGWEPDQFWEMVEEMKRSPMMFRNRPESRLARMDITMERRATRAS